MHRLLVWAILSMLVGAVLLLLGNPFWQGFGIQAIAWGSVDGIIVLFGRRRVNQAMGKHADEGRIAQEANKIRKILWINTGLDVLYIASGVIIILTLGRTSSFWQGNGWGIIIQAAFLFVFDLWHALHVPNLS